MALAFQKSHKTCAAPWKPYELKIPRKVSPSLRNAFVIAFAMSHSKVIALDSLSSFVKPPGKAPNYYKKNKMKLMITQVNG